ncbi:MAG: hypothetical protein KC435_02090 [Thermomicrobiales bacterium]|nr:hypothetical protein [Thermomicrobiales bacterium]
MLRISRAPRLFLIAIITAWMMIPLNASTQETTLPPITLDVLEGYVWSSTDLSAAPGQTITITNRDVSRHTFTIDAWSVDISLASLQPVDYTIPSDVAVGSTVEFYSSIPGDREGGLVGTLTVVSPEDILAGLLLNTTLQPTQPQARVRIEALDDFTFQPAIVSVAPGTLIEIVNTGVISHHFVVDDWKINQTIAPGDMVLVRVPSETQPGTTINFYCSVPGHEQQGMVGVLRISQGSGEIANVVQTGDGLTQVRIDMRPFLPDESALGTGWTRLRSGSSDSVLGSADLNAQVFPYSGLGAIYVGPNGARMTVVVLPLYTDAVPNNQVTAAVQIVQGTLSADWSVDRIASAAYKSIAAPDGCTVSERVSGIVPTVTLPGGVTSCQLSGVGVIIVASVEGEYDGESGVDASDHLIEDIVTGKLVGGEGG